MASSQEASHLSYSAAFTFPDACPEEATGAALEAAPPAASAAWPDTNYGLMSHANPVPIHIKNALRVILPGLLCLCNYEVRMITEKFFKIGSMHRESFPYSYFLRFAHALKVLGQLYILFQHCHFRHS